MTMPTRANGGTAAPPDPALVSASTIAGRLEDAGQKRESIGPDGADGRDEDGEVGPGRDPERERGGGDTHQSGGPPEGAAGAARAAEENHAGGDDQHRLRHDECEDGLKRGDE